MVSFYVQDLSVVDLGIRSVKEVRNLRGCLFLASDQSSARPKHRTKREKSCVGLKNGSDLYHPKDEGVEKRGVCLFSQQAGCTSPPGTTRMDMILLVVRKNSGNMSSAVIISTTQQALRQSHAKLLVGSTIPDDRVKLGT